MDNEKECDDVLFLGEFDHVLDAQGRITIPRDWRSAEGESDFVLFPARDAALLLFPVRVFMEFVARTRKLAIANPDAQKAFVALGANSRRCRSDRHGRIALERKMLDSIHVGSRLKMLGAISHIRLCAEEKWEQPTGAALGEYLDEIQKMSATEPDLASLLAQGMSK